MLMVIDELRERIENGEVVSLGVMAEVTGRERPDFVVVGRYERNLYAALAALQRANASLLRRLDKAEREQPDFHESF